MAILFVQPIADGNDQRPCLIVMLGNVLSGDVRAKLPKSVSLCIEDQATLSLLLPIANPPCPKKNSQLKRHVEPGEAVGWIQLGS
jgi:hypothetical protein